MSYLSDLLGTAYKEGMTEEELSEAVKSAVANVEKKASLEATKLKNALDKTSSEVADYKKKLQAKQTDEEQKKAAQEELLEQLRAENEAYKKANQIADYKANLLGLGYTEELAAATAEAIYDGDMQTAFQNMKSFGDSMETRVRANLMKQTPVPPASGGGSAPVTKDSIMAIKDPIERQAAISKNLELFEN